MIALAAGVLAASFLHPCDVPGVKAKAECGTYEVWEDRAAKSGRRIGLNVVVLRASGSPRASDALTFLAGGPGQGATSLAPFLAPMFGALLEHRDLLLVDQRGTGGSHPLECNLYPGSDAQSALGSFFPLDRVKECRLALEKTSDLRMYTTAATVDDLDEVRAALGYDKLDLFGGSYGTRAAQAFMQRHPERVRVAVLKGVQPTSDPVPLNFPKYAQQAIEQIFSDCRADARCHSAFPDLDNELRAIVARAAAKPVDVEVLDSRTADPVHISLSRDLLGEALRYLMYESSTALFVPLLVHQAASGDFVPLAEFALGSRRQLVNSGGQGLYLSVTCSEDLPFIAPADAEGAAANMFLGDYRYRQQRAACAEWVRGAIPADLRKPVHADAPVLLVSGSWDPVTPPSDAKEVAASLSRSVSVLIPAGGHSYDGIPGADDCVNAIARQVVDRASTDVDTSCVSKLKRPPFPTKPLETRVVKLTNAQISSLAGHYTGSGVPALDIVSERGKLIGRLQGDDEPVALAPTSPTRLRLLGMIGAYLDADPRNGTVTLERGGAAELSWKKSRGK